MPDSGLRDRLEALYQTWHHPRNLGTDPLVLVRGYDEGEREVVAFVVAALALGRASLIVPAARRVLASVPRPVHVSLRDGPPVWRDALAGFRYRFFSGAQVAALFDALADLLRRHGTLEAAWRSTGATGWPATRAFCALFAQPPRDLGILVPVADSNGASKRLNLFLRWMVRRDDVDPGGWTCLRPADLFMPIDTHVLQWARREGLTLRTVADQKACVEITGHLRELCPEDPLRYDFAITRQGMDDKRTLTRF